MGITSQALVSRWTDRTLRIPVHIHDQVIALACVGELVYVMYGPRPCVVVEGLEHFICRGELEGALVCWVLCVSIDVHSMGD